MPDEPRRIRRVLVVLPNWVGDVVLATPALAAIREHFNEAKITFLMRRYVAEVVAGGGWHDREEYWPKQRGLRGLVAGHALRRRLQAEWFDIAVLLPNSFRSALIAFLARVPKRVGFGRDGRSWLLTDRLRPLKRAGDFVPASVRDSYLQITERIGCRVDNRQLRLGVTPEQQRAAAELMQHHGLTPRGYAVINPGAAFGAAKCWLPERFAETCDRLHDQRGLRCVIVGGSGEVELMRRIAGLARTPAICCENPGTTLGSLKPLIRDAAVLVCNDTGPRHYGLAFGVPTVTVFGPTHQAWTETGCASERKLQVPVPCGPCQLRVCPLDHRCMTGVSVDMVVEAASNLLQASRGGRLNPVP